MTPEQKKIDRTEREQMRSPRGMWRRDLALMAACLVVLFGAERLLEDRNNAVQRADTLDAIGDAIEKNCTDDTRFREQYRVRGIAEQQLLKLFISLAKEPPPTAEKRTFLEKFGPLVEQIDIIPLPDCDNLRSDLDAALADSNSD